jgi:hypothetical protein
MGYAFREFFDRPLIFNLDRFERIRPRAAVADRRPWYSIATNSAGDAKKTAEILIYDEIDPFWGVSAGEFANELNALEADEITVGINSPVGIVFDGIAISSSGSGRANGRTEITRSLGVTL